MSRKKIQPGDLVPVAITLRQRDLITEHIFAEPDLTEPLRLAETKGRTRAYARLIDEVNELPLSALQRPEEPSNP